MTSYIPIYMFYSFQVKKSKVKVTFHRVQNILKAIE